MHGKICGMNEGESGRACVLSFEPEGLLSNPGKPCAAPEVGPSGQAYVPTWQIKKRVGARFSFGNKLLTFSSDKSTVGVHHRPQNQDLVKRIDDFMQQLENNVDLSALCHSKSKSAQHDHDVKEFLVLKCILDGNYDELLRSFGIDKKKTTFEVEKYLGRKLHKTPEPQ
jgi:hypothetical protein